MKSHTLKYVSQLMHGTFLIIHSTTYSLWLPPLLLEEKQPLKTALPKENNTPTVTVADAAQVGKTHFLIGSSPQQPTPSAIAKVSIPASPTHCIQPAVVDGIPLNTDGHVCTVLFDKFYDTLAMLIEREQKKISLAAYMLTDKRIAHLLEEAHARGVIVEVVTDLSCLRERSNKLGDLYEAGISVFICMPERKGAKSSLMHNKFILFDTNIYNRKIIWTGSANMTRSALTEVHHENVVVFDDSTAYKAYEKEFKQLKQKSERYESCTITNAALHEKIRTSERNNKNVQEKKKSHAIT